MELSRFMFTAKYLFPQQGSCDLENGFEYKCTDTIEKNVNINAKMYVKYECNYNSIKMYSNKTIKMGNTGS